MSTPHPTEAEVDPDEPNTLGEIVYAELNLEKWPIWEPRSTKKEPRARVFKRERALADGSHVTASVEVGFTQHGGLSTRDQKVYYVLLKLWDDMGRPETPITFSLQGIARQLDEDWGQHTRLAIYESLLRLRGVLFVWENSYFDKATGEHLELLDTFNILSQLTIARRTKSSHATNAACEFQFHERLLASLRANHTTPLFLDTVLGFRSEIAQLLYSRLDLILADKDHYERRTKELFVDLGLEAETYRHRSARKRVLDLALLELVGVPLTTGRIASATTEPTKDGLDFKLVIRKGAFRKPGRPRKALAAALPPAAPAPAALPAAPRSAARKSRVAAAAPADDDRRLLADHFQRVFHGAPSSRAPGPREAAQAARLIEAHGLDKARALVDFAKAEADKTKYAPASLNGILQYEARFEAGWEARARARDRRQQSQARQRQAREAEESRQRDVAGALAERVATVREAAPEAFASFVRHVEAERDKFLATPVARRASPEMREMLAREYARPAKRLEMFVTFFRAGGQGEVLLRARPQAHEVAAWLQAHGDAVHSVIAREPLAIEVDMAA